METINTKTIQEIAIETYKEYALTLGIELKDVSQYNGQFLQQALELDEKNIWEQLYKTFLTLVKNHIQNIFVQESSGQKLSLITLLGKYSDNMSFQSKRQIVNKQQLPFSAVLLDLWNCKVVSSWINHPQEYDSYEIDQICDQLNQCVQDGNQRQTFEFTSIPVGSQVSLNYLEGNWNISTRNTIRINESTLIGTMTIEDALKKLLAKHKLSMNDLNKQLNYKFQFNLPQYQVIYSAEYIYLTEILDANNIDLLTNIPENPCLVQKTIKQFPKSTIYGPIHFSHIIRGIHRYSGHYPTQYLQIKFVNPSDQKYQYFTIRSHLAEVLDYIRQNSADKNTQKINLNQFIKQFPKNKFVKQYMQYYQ